MNEHTKWYLGPRSKLAANRYMKEIMKHLDGNTFGKKLPEWTKRLKDVPNVRRHSVTPGGVLGQKGLFGEVRGTIVPGQERAVLTKELTQPAANAAAIRDAKARNMPIPTDSQLPVPNYTPEGKNPADLVDDLWDAPWDEEKIKQLKGGLPSTEYERMMHMGKRPPNVEKIWTDPEYAAAMEAQILRELGEARKANPNIDKLIEVPELLEETVSRRGNPVIRMTGVDVGDGFSDPRAAERAAAGLDEVRKADLGYTDAHMGNVKFRDGEGNLRDRPAILDWGMANKGVKDVPALEEVGAGMQPGAATAGGTVVVDHNLPGAMRQQARVSATPAQRKLLRDNRTVWDRFETKEPVLNLEPRGQASMDAPTTLPDAQARPALPPRQPRPAARPAMPPRSPQSAAREEGLTAAARRAREAMMREPLPPRAAQQATDGDRGALGFLPHWAARKGSGRHSYRSAQRIEGLPARRVTDSHTGALRH